MKNNKKSVGKKEAQKKVWIVSLVLTAAIIAGGIGVKLWYDAGRKAENEKLTASSESTASTQSEEKGEDNSNNSNTKEENKMTEENVKVLVTMENGEDFVIELYPEYAPQTVQNFVDLVSDGFYDGVGFHRVVDGFMAQGGDPEGTGMGGSGVNIPGEFAANGFAQNTLSHTRGVISMARSQNPDSASSQFFICYDDASFLDGQYAAFGKVIEGMETVDGFLDVERSYNAMGEQASPVEPIVMKSVTIIED